MSHRTFLSPIILEPNARKDYITCGPSVRVGFPPLWRNSSAGRAIGQRLFDSCWFQIMAYEINTCPRCEEEKKEYILRYEGTSSTLMSGDRFAKNGVWHTHDPNRHCSTYRCSNGHVIEITYYRICPVCRFNSDKPQSQMKIFDNRTDK